MKIQIGSIITYVTYVTLLTELNHVVSKHSNTKIKGIVTDISTIENSIYYHVVSNHGYDHWIHKSQIINTITNEADTVIRHLHDLYK